MKVLIVGGGGREHALAWKCAQSARVDHVFVAPGNAGTALEPGGEQRRHRGSRDDIETLVNLAARAGRGIRTHHRRPCGGSGEAGRRRHRRSICRRRRACFGPSRAAARLEGSKAFTKEFLERHRIPTASYAAFDKDSFDPAYPRAAPAPGRQGDGLAAGKGAVICETHEAAIEAAAAMLGGSRQRRPHRGDRRIPARRGSQLHRHRQRSSGAAARHLADHKRRGRRRSRTHGGMGAYLPAPLVTPATKAAHHARSQSRPCAGCAPTATPIWDFYTPA